VVFEKPEDKTSVHAKRLEQSIQSIGGIVDGGPARVLVLTVPVSSGFKAIESLLTAFMKEVPGTSWWYGNVYEAGDPSRPLAPVERCPMSACSAGHGRITSEVIKAWGDGRQHAISDSLHFLGGNCG
jgi:hypothetical protein